jgi:hypothetical protein
LGGKGRRWAVANVCPYAKQASTTPSSQRAECIGAVVVQVVQVVHVVHVVQDKEGFVLLV